LTAVSRRLDAGNEVFAEVAVNAAAPIRQTFTYRVPDGMTLAVGQAVYVPFGARTLQGIVTELTELPAYEEARDIEALIEERPIVSEEHIALARWMSEYYLAPLFDCIALMLPAGFKRRPLTYLRPAFWAAEAAPELTPLETEVFESVREHGEIETEALKRAVKGKGVPRAISSLVRKGVLARAYQLSRPIVAPKVVTEVRLLKPEADVITEVQELRDAGSARDLRRAVLLDALLWEPEMPLSRARKLGLTPALLRDLEADGVVAVEDVTIVRDPLAGRTFPPREPPQLTEDQHVATGRLVDALDSGHSQVFLLHGVTGSGKTEVYLAALDHAVSLGKRAIVLVPEIALTPQTIRRFAERFPGEVAVLHSELSLGEQFDVWHEIRDGRYKVVVGPRGALFAPQPDLGIVVLDEEHEWTYKQEEMSPRYHARRAAEELCRLTGATVVLGSATPDVETHFRAQEGDFRVLELPQRLIRRDGRVEPALLPEVEVVDLREELKEGNRSIFSRSLAQDMRSALDAGEQIMLFLNRRGTASFMQCRDCGHVPECRSCAVALTYHAPANALICHYCHRRTPLPGGCPACGSGRFRPIGLGTERVEEEVRQEFPGARTLRWDRDVTGGRDSHEAILAKFLAHEADILIGTQMIAKGLDIPLVTLVGVVSADIALHLPDFRAGERTFQLLEQVAGRAGRGPRGGKVIIQTYSPDHYAIEAAGKHDYHALYTHEIDFRRRTGYPPFGRIARLTFAHTNSGYAQRQAAEVTVRLRSEITRLGLPNIDVLGPAPAHIPRIRGRWRWNILVRGADPAPLLRDFTLARGWTLDIDPASTI
jgi:primosomal protein N' (replication factor Y)